MEEIDIVICFRGSLVLLSLVLTILEFLDGTIAKLSILIIMTLLLTIYLALPIIYKWSGVDGYIHIF